MDDLVLFCLCKAVSCEQGDVVCIERIRRRIAYTRYSTVPRTISSEREKPIIGAEDMNKRAIGSVSGYVSVAAQILKVY